MEKRQRELCFEILRRFNKAGILKDIILIGSWSAYFYNEYFADTAYLDRAALKTRDIEKLFLELKTEWNNMILYASDEVLLKSHVFLNKPSHENYKKLAIEMRKDLWGGKISREIEKLNFENFIPGETMNE